MICSKNTDMNIICSKNTDINMICSKITDKNMMCSKNTDMNMICSKNNIVVGQAEGHICIHLTPFFTFFFRRATSNVRAILTDKFARRTTGTKSFNFLTTLYQT